MGRLRWLTALALGVLPVVSLVAQEAEPPPIAAAQAEVTLEEPKEAPATSEAAVATPPAEQASKLTCDAPTEFQLPFPEERGGGIAKGRACGLSYENDRTVVLSGGVELFYKDVVARAQTLSVDLTTRIITAEGEVTIDQGPQRLAAATAVYDLENKTGMLTEATAYVDPDFYFSGAKLEKTGDQLFEIEQGTLTSCKQEVPDWSFRLKRATVEVEGYAKIHGASMRVKKLPVLYIPYIIWPAKRERASGLLIPQPGYSNRRGFSLSLAYFQELGRSFDTTVFVDAYTKSYLGIGNELRYRPSEGTEGIFEGYAIRDPERDDWRWKVKLDHVTNDLPWGMRGAIAFRDYSDFDYLFDFERDFDRNTLRSISSKGFVSGNWSTQSLNILVEDLQTLTTDGLNTRIISDRRLPEVEYRLRPTQLGKLPLFVKLDSSLAYLDVNRTPTFNGSYGRFDVTPAIEASVLTLPFLSASVTAGYRYTWYGDSLCRPGAIDPVTGLPASDACSAAGREFLGESLTRDLPLAEAQVVGPSFSRIYNKKVGPFGKFMHIIEPRLTYSYSGDVDLETQARIPNFDEVDFVGSGNVGRIALVNRILARPSDEKKGSAREIFSLELFRNYSFDSEVPLQQLGDETDAFGPIQTRVRFDPSQRTSLQAQVTYSTLASLITQRSLSGALGLGTNSLGLTWFTSYTPVSGEKVSDQARLWTTLNVIPNRLRLEAQLAYDLRFKELQQQSYAVGYTAQCYAFRLEAREFQRVDQVDRDYRFLLTLKNVGTFLDVNGRQSTAGTF